MFDVIVLILAGRPSDLYDVKDEDWAPTLKLGHSKQPQMTTRNNGIQQEGEQTTMENNNEPQKIITDVDSRPQQESAEIATLALKPNEPEATLSLMGDMAIGDHELPAFNSNEISCQTQLTMKDIDGNEEDDQNVRSELLNCNQKP